MWKIHCKTETTRDYRIAQLQAKNYNVVRVEQLTDDPRFNYRIYWNKEKKT